ncbi:hypothetical protein [Acinetobacter lwoffii]|uniref:hypothetical protein n=1 Tax=Acinetobacter lwoffii TaxID=28090 RepID=UPI002DBBA29E|nr:hypothetical protein [Acinetobacter lwoffii]MEB6680420.1 hypothetical protein [Acinetobacter lwoffii]
MTAVQLITITAPELEAMMDRVCRKAVLDAFAQKEDELLNIDQLCERIPGLTRYIFKKIAVEAKLKCIRGKYSLNAVKAAMQSR